MYYNAQTIEERAAALMYRVYGWMAMGLGVTAIVSYALSRSPEKTMQLATNSIGILLLFGIQIALVVALSSFLSRLSLATAIGFFLGYAALTGITLSPIFLLYTQTSIAVTFAVCASMFAVMALYGYFTKADLTAVGSIAIMTLFGLIIGGIINMWLVQSQGFDLFMSAIGVVIFSALTAYDVQRIKNASEQMLREGYGDDRIAILDALMLYLDFINLFLYLLRFLGDRRKS